MRTKVLAPAATETEFAVRALNISEFEYASNIRQLYHREHTVRIVDRVTYEFNLRDLIFEHLDRSHTQTTIDSD